MTTCVFCGQPVVAVNEAGLCPACAEIGLAKPSDPDAILEAVSQATDVEGIAEALARFQPPVDPMIQAVLREKLMRAIHGKVKSPAKVIDAWLGSAPKTDDAALTLAQVNILVTLALENAQLFHDRQGEPYAMIHQAGHWETHHVRKRTFRLWLGKLWYDEWAAVQAQNIAGSEEEQSLGDFLARAWKAPSAPAPQAQAVRDAVTQLEALAVFEGDEQDVHVRLASVGNLIYLDLGDADWKAVEISKSGWGVVSEHGIRFVRAPGMLPLPEPKPGLPLSDLRRFINCADHDWPLIAAFIVGLFMPDGPYPVLNLNGEHGSAKTSSARRIRSLVDPYSPPDRGRPRNERDLAINAAWSWCLSFDNLGSIPDWLSDAFCRIATGGGFGARLLYTDDEERLFDSTRPIILNGIGNVATRGDLLDRSIVVNLPRIEAVLDTETLSVEWERAWPALLGACLDAVSTALARREQVTLPELPRMADFARWATAAEPGLGLADGEFLNAYLRNRDEAQQIVVEAEPVALAIVELMAEGDAWSGTTTELFEALTSTVSEITAKSQAWPKAPSALGLRLRQIAPDLRSVGLDISFASRHGRARTVTVTRLRKDRPSRPNRPHQEVL
jgi:hypothetical protein